jgi:hypothetical protein
MYTYSNCPIESNTGFEQVYKSGKYYLNNNIPDEVKQSRYKNPRLNEAKAIKYTHMLNRWEKFKIKKFKKPDEKWIDCWEEIRKPDGSTYRPNPEACYKSTIIIPMTLRENKYGNPEFFKRFRIQDDTERAIYGFLCIDHHQEDFFEQEPDQRIGYIFADIMSLYLITHLTYTRYSKTYPKVKQYLKK